MFSIVCNARKDRQKGIRGLVLVDRSLDRRRWWTHDNAQIIRIYECREAARDMVNQLSRNNARIVTVQEARRLLHDQARKIADARRAQSTGGTIPGAAVTEEIDPEGLEWDAHKA